MPSHGTHNGPPERIRPIDTERAALAILTSVVDEPRTEQVIAIMLDQDGIGCSILVVHDTTHPDAMLDVVDVLAESIAKGGPHVVSDVILASVRPGGTVDPGDADRWFEASETFADHSIELLEWFVMTDTITCPRDLLGIAPRWRVSQSVSRYCSPRVW